MMARVYQVHDGTFLDGNDVWMACHRHVTAIGREGLYGPRRHRSIFPFSTLLFQNCNRRGDRGAGRRDVIWSPPSSFLWRAADINNWTVFSVFCQVVELHPSPWQPFIFLRLNLLSAHQRSRQRFSFSKISTDAYYSTMKDIDRHLSFQFEKHRQTLIISIWIASTDACRIEFEKHRQALFKMLFSLYSWVCVVFFMQLLSKVYNWKLVDIFRISIIGVAKKFL